MTDHDRFLQLAATALDFDLGPDERAELEAHLATCPSCQVMAAALCSDRDALSGLPRIDAPESVRQAVLASGQRRSWRPTFALQALVVAALAVVPVALAIFALSNSDFGCGFCGSAGAGGEGPSTIAWQRLTVAPAPGTAALELHAVVYLADRIVAVGVACANSAPASACYAASAVSADGAAWTSSATDATLGVEPLVDGAWSGMRAVSRGGPGVVAVGVTGIGGRPHAVAWLSSEGLHWSRAADDASFAGAWMNSVTVLNDGTLLAVGGADTASGTRAAAWTSVDGSAWMLAPDAAPDVGSADLVIAGRPAAGMRDAVSAADGPIAVGASCAPGQATCNALAWISAEASSWTQLTDATLGVGIANAATSIDAGLVVVGQRPSGAATWRSTESGPWSARVLPPASSGGLQTVTALGSRAIAAGIAGSDRSGIWATSDGLSWSLERGELFDGATVFDMSAAGENVAAVGALGAEEAVVWLGQEIPQEK